MTGTPEFEALYEQHVLTAYDHQMHLNEAVHGSWDLDNELGQVTFSHDDRRFVTPVQMLGTQSAVDGTWLWSWANERSDIPEAQLQAVKAIRDFGYAHGIIELTEPMITAEGHRLAMVAVGLTKLSGYYRCPYDGGAAFVLLVHPDAWSSPKVPVVRIASVLKHLITQVELTHPIRSLLGWGRFYGLAEAATDGALRLVADNGDAVEVQFDESRKIVGIGLHVEPRTAEMLDPE